MPDQQPDTRQPRVAPWTRGLDDGFTQAIELVAATVVVGLVGAWLDHRLGTSPLLTLVLGGLALAGACAKLYFGYVARMDAEEAGKPWARDRGRTP